MSQYADSSVLVDTQWLANHLNDPNVRIIEVDMSLEPYKNAHIPSAVFWNIFTDLLLPDLKMNWDAQAFEKLMARSGITNDTTVIAYGSYPGTGAWIFWLLKVFGHENARVLNGGYQKWKSEACPLLMRRLTLLMRSPAFKTLHFYAKLYLPITTILTHGL
ncbi:rhodanese-like domain-containing protein [Nostoc sp.]|uniref:rhodanese-like domain-containing protein n=1 Tax=Nostoc sp. TaxID=1180 RepID=UPI002FF89AF4